MNVPFVKTWIAALRSGAWNQTYGALHRPNDTYCGNGVACELSGLVVWGAIEDSENLPFYMPQPSGIATYSALATHTGLSVSNFLEIQRMNDDRRCSFSDIADYLESLLLMDVKPDTGFRDFMQKAMQPIDEKAPALT